MSFQLRLIIRAVTGLLLLFISLCVAAHELKPAIVDLNYVSNNDDKRLIIEMIVNLESLMADIGPEHDNTDDSENSERYKYFRELEQDALLQEFSQFEEQFLSSINILDSKGERLNLGVHTIDIPSTGSTEIGNGMLHLEKRLLGRTATRKRWTLPLCWHQEHQPNLFSLLSKQLRVPLV